jgi:TRAP-type C4-dicarboxylate transport system substrate-binding protein
VKKTTALFITAIMCLGVLLTACGIADAAKYRLTNMYPLDYYAMQAMSRACDTIREQTNGEVDIVLYPSNQLGGYENCYQEVMRGTIEMCLNYPTSRFNKKFEIASVPGLAMGYDELKKLLAKDSPFHNFMKEAYAENGVVYLGSYLDDVMNAQIAKGKEIRDPYNPKTSKGLTLRVVPVKAWRQFYLAMGYQIATIPWAEIFSSMQTGIIDGDTGAGAEQTLMTLKDILGTYVEYTGGNVGSTLDFCINKKVWDSFDAKTQTIIEKAFDAERDKEFADAMESHDKALKTMQELGVKIYKPTPEQILTLNKVAQENCWTAAEDAVGKDIFKEIQEYIKK